MTEDMRTPILPGKGASDYERYLRTDELLALQKPPDEMLHPDELTFQVTHQASELLMKGAAWELDRARISIQQGDYRNAARLLRRANKMLVHPLRMLALLETITPYEYHIIRAGLGHGSGLDSPGFLALLHICAAAGRSLLRPGQEGGSDAGAAVLPARRIFRAARNRRRAARLRRAHPALPLRTSEAGATHHRRRRGGDDGHAGRGAANSAWSIRSIARCGMCATRSRPK